MERANKIDIKLFRCSFDGDIEGVMDALAQGGRVEVRNFEGFSPLLAAAEKGHADICGLLLAHGSDVNEKLPDTKSTALHAAAGRGHRGVVEALLSWGAIVDTQCHIGTTPLYVACQEGHLACVLVLLKAGASVSMQCSTGSLPIHVAAGQNRVEIVRTLLDYGCIPDMVSCCGDTLTTTMTSFLFSAEPSIRANTTHGCSIGCS